MRQEGLLLFTTTWKKLQGIMLSEISQARQTNAVGYPLIGGVLRSCTQKNRVEWQ